jgi:exopolysaccharide production protein ExoQ
MATYRKPRWIRWAVGYLLLCQLQAFSIVDRAIYSEWGGKSGDKLTQTINILQIIVGTLLFFQGSRVWPRLCRGGALSALLAIFLLCSTAWSVDPGATVRMGVQYLFLIVGLVGAAETLEADDLMDLLAFLCFLAGIVSLVLLFSSPASVYSSVTGEFRGIFSQKNVLGQAMAMGALASLHGLWARQRGRFFNIIVLVVTSFAALKSQSATSCSVILLFCALGVGIQLLRRGGTSRIIGVVGLILLLPLALIFALNMNSLMETFGKDSTLSGRTDIWAYVWVYIYQRPLLGWGYAAFWSLSNPAAVQISDSLRWFVPEAHSGILEMLLSAGLIGTVMFVYLWVRTVRLSLRCMRTSESAVAITCFLICAGIVLQGISEWVLLYPGPLTSVFFLTGFFCERAISESRQRRPIAHVRPVAPHVASSPAAAE